jgi:hypothetical protein
LKSVVLLHARCSLKGSQKRNNKQVINTSDFHFLALNLLHSFTMSTSSFTTAALEASHPAATTTPLTLFLAGLYLEFGRVTVVCDQSKTTQPFAPVSSSSSTTTRNRRRSMDTICRTSDSTPCRPSRRLSICLDVKKMVMAPRMPCRRRSVDYTPASITKPGVPTKDQQGMLLQLLVSPCA